MSRAEILANLANECGHRRIDLRLSLREAAVKIGVPFNSLWRFEQGRGASGFGHLLKIAAWLDATDDDAVKRLLESPALRAEIERTLSPDALAQLLAGDDEGDTSGN